MIAVVTAAGVVTGKFSNFDMSTRTKLRDIPRFEHFSPRRR